MERTPSIRIEETLNPPGTMETDNPFDLTPEEIDIRIAALGEFMKRSLGFTAVAAAAEADRVLDNAHPNQVDPGSLGEIAFEAIVRGGMT